MPRFQANTSGMFHTFVNFTEKIYQNYYELYCKKATITGDVIFLKETGFQGLQKPCTKQNSSTNWSNKTSVI